jgi:hypothetical protein
MRLLQSDKLVRDYEDDDNDYGMAMIILIGGN